MHQRAGAARAEEAGGLRRVRHACTPERPLGAPMVSSEGVCAAYYAYRRRACRRLPHDPRFVCPAPIAAKDTILLGHGSGGKLSAELLRDIFLPAFANPVLARLEDQAVVEMAARAWPSPPIPSWSSRCFSAAAISARWRFTARSTIWPWAARARGAQRGFHSGRRLRHGRAAAHRGIHGGGRGQAPAFPSSPAIPKWWSAARATASTSTPRASAWCAREWSFRPAHARPGDAVILSGAIGDHGIAILTEREGLELEGDARKRFRAAQRPGGRDARLSRAACVPCATLHAAGWPAL